MKVTPDMMAKFEQCKSAEDVLDLAKNNNVVLTKEQAKKTFDFLQSEDISDEMMEEVVGGIPRGIHFDRYKF